MNANARDSQEYAFEARDVDVGLDASSTPNTIGPVSWVRVCDVRDIVPNTGVCALVGDIQIAVFRLTAAQGDLGTPRIDAENQVFAIDNYDPISKAAVLSRGIVGDVANHIVVASPIYKQHFDLQTGECLEAPEHAVRCFPVQLRGDQIWIDATPSG